MTVECIVDVERVVVHYADLFALLRDLRGMGETNCAWRRVAALDRRTLVAAAAIYDAMFGVEITIDATTGETARAIEASFNILSIGGWAPVGTVFLLCFCFFFKAKDS